MNRTHKLLATVGALFTLTVPPGCALAAVAGAGILITDEFRDDAVSVTFPITADRAWDIAKYALSANSDAPLHIDAANRSARTTLGRNVEQGEVTVYVEEWDENQARVFVDAKKFAVHNPERSQMVMSWIEAEILSQTR